MTGLTDLLERAATTPTDAVDLDDIARRARHRRIRRHLGGATLGLVLTAVAVTAIGSLPLRQAAPAIVGEPAVPVVDHRDRQPATGGRHVVDGPAVAAPGAVNGAPRALHTAAPGHDPTLPVGGVRTEPTPRERAGHVEDDRAERHEGCRVEVNGPRERCTYTATRPGGYDADGNGSWSITIERGDEKIVINGETDPWCGQTGTIQPGDRVTVALRDVPPIRLSYGGHSFVGAGTEYGIPCN